jgi:hypothetical protein
MALPFGNVSIAEGWVAIAIRQGVTGRVLHDVAAGMRSPVQGAGNFLAISSKAEAP